ncbi:hypothetical protein HYC85_029008 [Camellia sinensis]|uniref:Pseudouridine synthase RsuA/RluA-like domain-containing protein n=1 Tax=Camellia sinensis TaxID=4442 RepID=A0A7J7FXG5_CAMSI|nr:hypothetical protein HYC85_029008 [Camellia sinensis]
MIVVLVADSGIMANRGGSGRYGGSSRPTPPGSRSYQTYPFLQKDVSLSLKLMDVWKDGEASIDAALGPIFEAIHRLDRLVSGLLILATSASKADLFRQQLSNDATPPEPSMLPTKIEAGMVEKQYVAKVIGVFPEDEQVVNANVNYNAREGRSTTEVESVENGSTALKGKAACTKFTRISTNGTHSIILCEPITGRTHQASSVPGI